MFAVYSLLWCSGPSIGISASSSAWFSLEFLGDSVFIHRFGMLKCRYCFPFTISLSPMTDALFLGFMLLAFFIAGIKIFLLMYSTRLGRSSPILTLELLRLRRIFHTLSRSLRQVKLAIMGLGRPRLCFPRRCTPQNLNSFTSSRSILRSLVRTARIRPVQSSSELSGTLQKIMFHLRL